LSRPDGGIRWNPAAFARSRDGRRDLTLGWLTPAWIAAAAALGLSVLGVEAIATTRPDSAARQWAFLPIGLVAALVVAAPDYRRYRTLVPLLAAGVVFLLVFVLLPGVPDSIVRPRNGARSWISLGGLDFQPSELAKTVFILAMAAWLSSTAVHRKWWGFLVTLGLAAVPVGLIVLEPDLGSALLFLPTLAAMLVAARGRLSHLLAGVLLTAVLGPVAYVTALQPYQRARIDAIVAQWQGDTRFEQREGFQGWRAMRLVGSGGVAGVGEEHARSLVRLNALPEEHNDMIFAVVAVRWGAIGALATVAGYLAIVVAALATALLGRDGFGRLVAVGIAGLTLSQASINIGMTIGLLPITGITLPFVSYGGTSLVASWINIGLLLGVGLRRPRPGDREGPAYGEVA
jgi:cell division protein FtsW (lipid II flippase)